MSAKGGDTKLTDAQVGNATAYIVRMRRQSPPYV